MVPPGFLNHKRNWSSRIFIARNPQYVRNVFSFVMDETFLLPLPSNVIERQAIEKEFEFFKIPCKLPSLIFFAQTHRYLLINLQSHTNFKNNNIVSENAIKTWLPNKQFQLLYKATVYVNFFITKKEREKRREKRWNQS